MATKYTCVDMSICIWKWVPNLFRGPSKKLGTKLINFYLHHCVGYVCVHTNDQNAKMNIFRRSRVFKLCHVMSFKTMQILFRRRFMDLFKLRVRACVCVRACACVWVCVLVNALHFHVWSKSLATKWRRKRNKKKKVVEICKLLTEYIA